MSVTLFFLDGSQRHVPFATITPQPTTFRRELYRAPYGRTWRAAGDGRRTAEMFDIDIKIYNDDLSVAAGEAKSLIRDVVRAAKIQGWFGEIGSAGVIERTWTPIEGGYSLRMLVSSNPGRRAIGGLFHARVAVRGQMLTAPVAGDQPGIPPNAVMWGEEPVMWGDAHVVWTEEE